MSLPLQNLDLADGETIHLLGCVRAEAPRSALHDMSGPAQPHSGLHEAMAVQEERQCDASAFCVLLCLSNGLVIGAGDSRECAAILANLNPGLKCPMKGAGKIHPDEGPVIW